MATAQNFRKELLENPTELKARYDLLEPEHQLMVASLALREANNLTQTDLAKLMDTSQANISKLENGKLNPSVALLKRLAKACDVKLSVYLQ